MSKGEALKRCREAKGLTQAELGRMVGIDHRRIQNYEQGVRDINRAECITVLRIAEALGVDAREILNEEEA